MRKKSIVIAVTQLAIIISLLLPVLPTVAPQVARAATNTLTLKVVSARNEPRAFGGDGVAKGAPITTFKYIINVDNTGTNEQRNTDPGSGCSTSDPDYPANCYWISIAGSASSSPIYTQGDQSDFDLNGVFQPGDLPAGRYLISVIADGYKLDGAHFSVPLDGPVTVELQPFPLPDVTIRAWVFEDISPTNSAPDAPAEHGLAGFVGHITDYIDFVTTDVYGNPLCTRYEGEDPETFAIPESALDADGLPIPIPGSGGQCVSDATGMLAIPHLGPNRYALSAVPPDGSDWIQTTTLEGNHDWDAWVMEGSTGYDTEFVVAGEPFPAIFFGFVHPTNTVSGGTGQIKGTVAAFKAYIPAKGGVIGGEPMLGSKVDHVIKDAWISLSDLQNGDTAVWIQKDNPDGTFTIPNVPDGNYALAYWDEPQDYILNFINVSVAHGEVVDLGVLPLAGWWTEFDGYVFSDDNRNGKMDWQDLNGNGCPDGGAEGEKGLANFPVTMKKRENSVMDRGATLVTTDGCGHYYMENAYPMTQWLVMEAYSDLVYTTGVTYQSDNQPEPTTVIGQGVDVSVLPIIGLGGRLDWGVHAYDPTGANGIDPRNGGIVGTVSYDTTRNELDPKFAAVENWQPGIPDLNVNLYAPVLCGTTGAPCDATQRYELAADGSFAKGQLLNTYVTETWERPTGCVARDVNGDPLVNGVDEQVLPVGSDTPGNDKACLEGPLLGVQFGTYATDQGTPDANFGAAVDGNYGFGDGCFGPGGFDPNTGTCADGSDPTPLTAGDYLVQVEIPEDALGRPLYQVTKEEDINIGNGDQFVPQVPPPDCAGALHTVDVAGFGTDGYGAVTLPNGVTVPASTPVDNPTFVDIGGSVYEGQQKPVCDMKLVRVSNGRSVAPSFNLFTDVPVPGRFWGLLVDDLNFSTNPKSLLYGEKAGVPFTSVGIYDWSNRLVATTESDYNGLFDVLLPSTNRINCPTPSGVCANLYRFVGNDPGIPGRLNPNYNPQFRTIAAEFEAFPGLIVPADLAPTQMGVVAQLPGSQFNQPVACTLDAATPQIFAVSQPYVNGSGSFTIRGQGFGALPGQVTLDGVAMPTSGWSDTSITVNVNTTAGPHQLRITAANGQRTVNGLTFHVLGFGAFPSTPVLDNFNRSTTSGNQGLGNNWGGDGNTTSLFRITPSNVTAPINTVQVRGGTTGTPANTWWTQGAAFGNNQEAYFTFSKLAGTEQGLLLKFNGPSPNSNNGAWIEVAYNGSNAVQVRTKNANSNTITNRGASIAVTFAVNDVFGARALSDGTVNVYRNGNLIGSRNVTALGAPASLSTNGGRIGVRFVGPTSSNDARFDNFGGGTVVGYRPNVYEVGPGKTYAVIQDAIDAAAASTGDDLVVVYPGLPDTSNPRYNPRGAYYENLIVTTPIKLQGVGPGGVIVATNTTINGSIIDGSAYGGDTALADAWRAKIATLTWVGNQTVSEGEVIYLLAQSTTQYGATYRASIDGFDLRGGDQQGQANIITQGGAIFANAYVRNLQITNNVIEANNASYGTVRIGTPDLPAPDTNQHNENLRLANNRILANSGTNLAGAIGLFAGADNYEVASNDICGNFSAEYGGGLTVYGLSPNGRIHDNRIYFNQSYDEGGGIMISGQLPANPGTLSPGSGPVDIYNNLIQSNLANDDGGGLRFLMAGNFAMNVYNNMIVNNISTHEGGGIALDDAPKVRVYNNTIMKNMTTATAVTSNGFPAPAGLSTTGNSSQLQATLPAGSPNFSNPLLFNNIFWDNRAGTRGQGTVTGLGAAGDATPINYWDLGMSEGGGLLAPTNSIMQVTTGTAPGAGNQVGVNPAVISTYDMSVSFAPWRTNFNFIGAILVAVETPANLLGNYHLASGSPAINTGAASKAVPGYQQPPATLAAPAFDIDNETRPFGGAYDIGADERH
jgi:hypothetical protein